MPLPDILAEHQLQPRLAEYPVVVIPDAYKLPEAFREALLRYVADGGSLFLAGEQCARLFAPVLGARLEGEPEQAVAELATPAGVVNVNGRWQKVVPETATVLAYRHPTRDTRKGAEVPQPWRPTAGGRSPRCMARWRWPISAPTTRRYAPSWAR